jgi:peptidoglycan/LPS O-acetylase OafA/YrhL
MPDKSPEREAPAHLLPGDAPSGTDVAGSLRKIVDQRDALPTPHQRVPILDGLRGIAILMVLVVHLSYLPNSGPRHPLVVSLLGAGAVGVDLFFVLSGFLITGILLDTRHQPHYFRNFYARRTVRIFPLYYGVLIVTLLLVPAILHLSQQTPRAWDLWLWTYTYNLPMAWPALGRPTQPNLNFGHFWTLAVEEQFYLIWPLVVFLLNKRTLYAALAGMVLAAAVRAWTMSHIGIENDVAKFFTLARCDGLCVGALLAVVVRRHNIRALARWATPVFLMAIILFPLLLLDRHTFGALKWLNQTLTVLAFGAALVILLDTRPTSLLHRTVTHPILLFFGKYSYAIYIFHYLLKPQFERIFASGKIGAAPFVLLASACATLLAFASWHLYEKHFLKLKRFFEYQWGK